MPVRVLLFSLITSICISPQRRAFNRRFAARTVRQIINFYCLSELQGVRLSCCPQIVCY